MSLIHVPDKFCPLCNNDAFRGKLDKMIYERSVDPEELVGRLKAKGFHFSEAEIRAHTKHFLRKPETVDDALLNIDKDIADNLETLDSEKVIDAKVKKIRIIMARMEQNNLISEPEYLAWHRELNATIALKEQLSGKLKTASDVNIDMSVFKRKIEEARKNKKLRQ